MEIDYTAAGFRALVNRADDIKIEKKYSDFLDCMYNAAKCGEHSYDTREQLDPELLKWLINRDFKIYIENSCIHSIMQLENGYDFDLKYYLGKGYFKTIIEWGRN